MAVVTARVAELLMHAAVQLPIDLGYVLRTAVGCARAQGPAGGPAGA